MRKTISVVMFVYNEEQHIAEMLESIYAQTVLPDKIIIVDDQSTDSTKAIVLDYKARYGNVIYIYNDRKGKVYAYEKGLNCVDTDLFMVCAGDDVLLPTYIEHLSAELTKKDLKFVYGRYFISNYNLEKKIEPKRKSRYSVDEILLANKAGGYLFGDSVILNDLLPLPEGLAFEDWYTAIVLSLKYGFVTLSDQPYFLYRKHDSSTTISLRNVGVRNRDITFIDFLLKEVSSRLNDKQVNSLLVRKEYCHQLVGSFGYFSAIKLLFSRSLFFLDKIRLIILFLPGFRDDNDVQKLIDQLFLKK